MPILDLISKKLEENKNKGLYREIPDFDFTCNNAISNRVVDYTINLGENKKGNNLLTLQQMIILGFL